MQLDLRKLQANLMPTASKMFLAEPLPADWEDWPDAKLTAWLEDHVWEPLDRYSGDELYTMIECAADSILNAVLDASEYVSSRCFVCYERVPEEALCWHDVYDELVCPKCYREQEANKEN